MEMSWDDRQADLTREFWAVRPRLLRIAYALLGSRSEAEDVVSDCWLSLTAADRRSPILDVRAWSTVAVSRAGLDVLRSARLTREQYVGPWLPEPDLSPDRSGEASPEDRVTLDESVSYALLVVLETLSAPERTAWVLHDLFGMDFGNVAAILGRSEAAVRQLASRARRHIEAGTPRVAVSRGEHRAITRAFSRACAEGDVEALIGLLDPDVVLLSDGGGQVVAAKRPVLGAAKVATFLTRTRANLSPEATVQITPVNGAPGIVIADRGAIATVISLVIDAGHISGVHIVRSPAKLPSIVPAWGAGTPDRPGGGPRAPDRTG